MKKAIIKILPFLNKDQKPRARKPVGQSLIEFGIALPVLILILTAMMEFGFILNFYLSLLDATREAARFASGADPFAVDPNSHQVEYYNTTSALVRGSLDPQVADASYQGRRLVLDPATDDVIVTVYCVNSGSVTAYPSAGGYHMYNNDASVFTSSTIQSSYLNGAPDAGLVLVEVYYSYHPIVGIFYNRPIMLRAYSIMPANAADPSPTCPTP